MKQQKNKYQIYLNEVVELRNKGNNLFEAAEIIHKKHAPLIKFNTFRRALARYADRQIQINEIPSTKKKAAVKVVQKEELAKPFVLSAWNYKTGLMMDIDEYCEHYKLPRQDITSYKLVTHTGTPFYNPFFKEHFEASKDFTFEFIDAAIKKHISPVIAPTFKGVKTLNCLRVIYTDAHIGMETNSNGHSLYGGVWNEVALFDRKTDILNEIQLAHKLFGNFDEIHVIDLGDYMDGWDAQTVRGGHELPQNMDNEKAFDVGLSFKVELIKQIVALNITNMVKSYNICNDNHAGSFGYVVNSAAKLVLEGLFPALVEVHNLRKFINHYYYGNHCFILSHGKDKMAKKFGFKPHLDATGREAIEGYIDNNQLVKHADFITFEKGDSHQQLFDYATSDKFDYMNYMALSPSSEWVQTNFKRGRSGFNLMIINKESSNKIMIPFSFIWQENAA